MIQLNFLIIKKNKKKKRKRKNKNRRIIIKFCIKKSIILIQKNSNINQQIFVNNFTNIYRKKI